MRKFGGEYSMSLEITIGIRAIAETWASAIQWAPIVWCRAEQTHILAAMIQLFQTGINVLYSVDYTGAIDNFNECEKWTQTEWLNCENKDVMEGIMFM